MSDDRPSALDDANGLGPALLSAGRDDWPSNEALSRTLAAVGAGVAVVTVAGSVAAGAGASVGSAAAKGGAALMTFGGFVKWLGVGAVSGVVVAGVAHRVTVPSAEPQRFEAPVVTPASNVREAEVNPRSTPKGEPALTAAPIEEPPKPPVSPPSHENEPDRDAERGVPLAAEVALVDRARAALANGRPAGALDALRGYETAFPDPRLEPEVLFLRMEAHLAAGNAPRARDTAEQSIRRFPRGPHAARARQVLEGTAVEKK